MRKFQVRADKVSNVKDPVVQGRYKLNFFAPAKEIDKFSRTGTFPWINPREGWNPDARKKSTVGKDIKELLLENGGNFHEHNKGLVIIAKDAKQVGDFVELDIDDSRPQGLCDGGTTTSIIVEALADGWKPADTQLVRVEVRCGAYDKPEIIKIVESLNTNMQVDDLSMSYFKKDIDWLERATLGSVHSCLLPSGTQSPAVPKVSWYVGDKGDVDGYLIAQLVRAMMEKSPESAYSSKNKALEVMSDKDLNQEAKQLANFVPDFMWLYEHIALNASRWYNSTGGKFRALEWTGGKDESKKNRDEARRAQKPLPMYGGQVDYVAHRGWLFPLLSSLQPAMNIGSGDWSVSPIEILNAIGGEMIRSVNLAYDDVGNLPRVGTNANLYENLRGKVTNYVYRKQHRR